MYPCERRDAVRSDVDRLTAPSVGKAPSTRHYRRRTLCKMVGNYQLETRRPLEQSTAVEGSSPGVRPLYTGVAVHCYCTRRADCHQSVDSGAIDDRQNEATVPVLVQYSARPKRQRCLMLRPSLRLNHRPNLADMENFKHSLQAQPRDTVCCKIKALLETGPTCQVLSVSRPAHPSDTVLLPRQSRGKRTLSAETSRRDSRRLVSAHPARLPTSAAALPHATKCPRKAVAGPTMPDRTDSCGASPAPHPAPQQYRVQYSKVLYPSTT